MFSFVKVTAPIPLAKVLGASCAIWMRGFSEYSSMTSECRDHDAIRFSAVSSLGGRSPMMLLISSRTFRSEIFRGLPCASRCSATHVSIFTNFSQTVQARGDFVIGSTLEPDCLTCLWFADQTFHKIFTRSGLKCFPLSPLEISTRSTTSPISL